MANLNFNNDQLSALSQMLCQNADEVLEKLNLGLRKDSKKYSGCCPIHNGDNITALNLYHSGHSMQLGNWICNTNHCQRIFNPTMIGFIRGVLSERIGWTAENDKKKDFKETLAWCLETLGKKPSEIKIDEQNIERQKFISLASTVNPPQKMEPKNKWRRLEFLTKVDTNNDYFINRGFSKEILHKYDVGLSKTGDKLSLAYNRVIAPIYDEAREYVIGGQGRSLFGKCGSCNLYHSPNLPCPTSYLQRHSKWVNIPEGFELSRQLYNYWFAKKEILKKSEVILVEGPPDIWKLEEAGYHNGLALCGANISDSQQIVLETLGVTKVYCMFDNDDAGQQCMSSVFNKLKRQFKIVNIAVPEALKDVGEMKKDEIQKLMGEYIKC